MAEENNTSLAEQLLNDQEEPSVTEQVLDLSKDPSLADQYLTDTEASEATEMSKHINGPEGPSINTEQDLADANEFEKERVIQEDETGFLSNSLSSLIERNAGIAAIQKDAVAAAYQRLFSESSLPDGYLRMSDLRQYQAEALTDGNVKENEESSFGQNYISKLDILDEKRREIVKSMEGRGKVWNAIAKTGDALKNIAPGYDALLVSDMYGKGFVTAFTPGDTATNFYLEWANLIYNENITPEAFKAILEAKLEGFMQASGASYEEALRFVDYIYANNSFVSNLASMGDLTAVTAGAGSVAKAGAKYGAKGAAVKAAKIMVPYVTPDVTKDIVRAVSTPINTAKKICDVTVDKACRLKLAGSTEKAGEAVAKSLGGHKPILNAAEARKTLGTPDIVANMDNKETIKQVFGSAVSVDEDITVPLKTTQPILDEATFRRQRDLLIEMADNDPTSLNTLMKQLWDDADVSSTAQDVMKRVKFENTEARQAVVNRTAEIIKAVPYSELMLDVDTAAHSSDIVTRVRLPLSFYKAESAIENLVNIKKSKSVLRGEVFFDPASKRYYIDADVSIRKGFGTLLEEAAVDVKKKDWSGSTKSALATVTSNPDVIKRLNYLKSLNSDKYSAQVKEVTKLVHSLSKTQQQELDVLLDVTLGNYEKGLKAGWYKPETLLAKGYEPDVVNAYSRIRAISDLDYITMNSFTRNEMVQKGIKDIWVNGANAGYGKILKGSTAKDLINKEGATIIPGYMNAEPMHVTDLTNSNVLSRLEKEIDTLEERIKNTKDTDEIERLTKILDSKKMAQEGMRDTVARLENGNLVAVQMYYTPKGNYAAKNVFYILPRDQVKEEILPEFVTNYLPGWRSYYDDSAVFLKQASIDSNGKILGSKTLMTGRDGKHSADVAKKLETLRQESTKIYNHEDLERTDWSLLDDLITKLSIPNAPFNDGKSWAKWALENGIDLENPHNALELVKNNQYPSLLRSSPDTTLSRETIDAVSKGKPYELLLSPLALDRLHRSGKTVFDFNFNTAKHLDFDRTMSKFLKDMDTFGVLSKYDQLYSESFSSRFRPLITAHIKDSSKLSNEDLLRTTNLQKAISSFSLTSEEKRVLSQAITAQKNYFLVKGSPSDFDKWLSGVGTGVLQSIGAGADALHIPLKWQEGVGVIYEDIMKLSPTKRFMAIVGHRYLGMLNPTQLVKNFVAPATYIMSVEPARGAAALKHLPSLMARLHGSDKGVLKKVYAIDKALGNNSDEMNLLFSNIMKLDARSGGIKGGFLNAVNTDNTFSKISLYFFNKADTWNRMMALDVACNAKGFGNVSMDAALDIARTGVYGDSLYINMGKRGLSRLQSAEATKIFTQFTGYMMREMEAMFDTELSVGQRASLGLTMLMTAGASGLIGAKAYNAVFGDALNAKEDDPLAVRVIKESLFQMGAPDMLMKELFNSNYSMQEMFSPNFFDFIDQNLNVGIIEAAMNTPAVKTIGDAWDAGVYTVKFLAEKWFGEPSKAEYVDLLKTLIARKDTFSTAELAERAIIMYNTGKRYSSSGELISDGNTGLAALLELAGIHDRRVIEAYNDRRLRQKHEDLYQEIVKQATKEALLSAKTGDPLGERIARQIIMNSDELSPQEKAKACSRVLRSVYEKGHTPMLLRNLYEELKFNRKTKQ